MSKINVLLKDKDERNLLVNIFFAFAVKGASLLVSLFSMPLYIRYFNDTTVLGLWYTILSMLSWVSICDLGLGNGLRNYLTQAISLNSITKGKQYITSTYVMISLIILPVYLIVIALISFFDLNEFLNIPSSVVSLDTLRLSIIILFSGIALSFILKLINNVIYAIQKSSVNNFLTLLTSILPVIYVLCFKSINTEQNLIWLSIVHAISINLPLIAATLILFNTKQLKNYRPSLRNFDLQIAKKMTGFGLQFFFAQLFFMFLMTTNEIIISKAFSPAYVVEYSIYYKVFTVVGSIFTLMLTPVWSKVTKDYTEKKYEKIKKINKVLYGLSFFACVAEFVMVLLLPFVFKIWLQEDAINVNYGIAVIFAFFGSVYIFNIVLTTIANGIGKLKTQIWFYGVGSLLKILAVPVIKWSGGEWAAVVLVTAAVLTVFCVYQMFWVKQELNKMTQICEIREPDGLSTLNNGQNK